MPRNKRLRHLKIGAWAEEALVDEKEQNRPGKPFIRPPYKIANKSLIHDQ